MLDDFKTFLEAMQRLSSLAPEIELRRQEIVHDLARSKAAQVPTRLFHYTSLQGACGILQSNNLWATDFRFLYDTNELVYGARILVEELQRFGDKHGGDVSNFLQKLALFYREHGDSYRQFFETYIISFSQNPDILSQWLAYAGNASGHCIEFDISDSRLFTIVDARTPWAMEISAVIYEEKVQRELIGRGIVRLVAYLNATEWPITRIVSAPELEQYVVLGFLIHMFEPFVTSFKHIDFSEEREWRAVVSCARNLTQEHRKEIIQGSNARPYIECIFIQGDEIDLWQRELLPIKGIIHGPLAEGGPIAKLEATITEEGYKDLIGCKRSALSLK